jgi:hypothetical protein
MAIVQISKIQQRSGNLVDLPQLDEAEFGWSSDAKRLFIGKTTPNENVEVLTSYSNISFSQIDGSFGNLDISNNVVTGQLMTYDKLANVWVNTGGNALDPGNSSYFSNTPVHLGNVANVKIGGGAIGYVLETDGVGNLAWTPKGTLYTAILGLSNANPIVMTVAPTTPYTNNAFVTISGVTGANNSIVNGKSFYVQVATNFSTTGNVSLYNETGGANAVDGAGLVYDNPGNAIATAVISGAGGTGLAGGSTTSIQYNNSGIITGDANLVYDFDNKILTLSGNANVANLNSIGSITSSTIVSNVSTGTPPITVSSTTRVNNLNVAYSNVTDFTNITTATTGTFYPVLTNGLTGNTAQFANNAISFNALTGNLTTSLLNVVGNANVGNIGVTTAVITTGNITTINSGLMQNGNSNITITSNGNVSVTAAGGTTELVITSTGVNVAGTLNVSGNANVGNLGTAGLIAATGNVTGGNLTTGGALSVIGNANVGNLGTAGLLVATGNITGGNLTTGGALSVIGNANVGNLGTAGLIVATGNITGGNLTTGGLVVATGNITGGNLTTSGIVSATGNVTAGNLYANSGTLGVSTANIVTLNVTGLSNLNAVANVYISGGNANQILKTDGAGNLSWTDPTGGYYLHTQDSANTVWTVTHNLNRQYVTVEAIDANGNSYTGRYDYPIINYTNANALTMTFTSAVQGYAAITGGGTNINSVSVGNSTPGGVDTQVQFNDAGTLAGSLGLVYNKTTGTLTTTLYAGSGANLTNIAGANVTGQVTFAATANAVAGANVSGAVAFATTANAVAGANVSGTVANATFATSAGSATTAGTVTTAAQPNVTSVGTLSSLTVSANVSTGGIRTDNYYYANGVSISFAGTYSNSNVSSFLAAFGSNTITTTGNISAGNISASGNISAGNFVGTGVGSPTISSSGTLSISATSGVTLNNVLTLSTGGNTTAGNITGNWTLTSGSRLQSTYADLAEYYEADSNYEPGTVLAFGGDKEVTIAEDGTTRVAGVVSTNPAYAMNATCQGIAVAIALQGRVPTKVRGTVRKGDMMVSAGNGYARSLNNPQMGTVIGKALENFDGVEGIIEIAVGRL